MNLSVSQENLGEQWDWDGDPLNFSESGWWGRILSAMKVLLTVLFCLCLPLAGADKKPLTKEGSAKVIEAAIRKKIRKPKGELTKADLEKVTTQLNLSYKQLPNVKVLCAPPPPSVLMAPFTSGHMTAMSTPSRPTPKASPNARGLCVGRMLNTRVG